VRVEGGGQGLGQGQEHLGVDQLVPGVALGVREHLPDRVLQGVLALLEPEQEFGLVEGEAAEQAEGPADGEQPVGVTGMERSAEAVATAFSSLLGPSICSPQCGMPASLLADPRRR
jgi:hypothetical protein